MRFLLALACALAPAATPAQGVRDALVVGDLICEFGTGGPRSLLADLVTAPRTSDLLLVYEDVTRGSAQVLSTGAPGRRPVQVRATDQAVHFIERLGPSVRVTTLTGCEQVKPRRGKPTCVRYAARHAWLFDERVLADPDSAFAELPSGAGMGRCEPWQVD
jgi:hypothetical protein